jgi:hypothetical protein
MAEHSYMNFSRGTWTFASAAGLVAISRLRRDIRSCCSITVTQKVLQKLCLARSELVALHPRVDAPRLFCFAAIVRSEGRHLGG